MTEQHTTATEPTETILGVITVNGDTARVYLDRLGHVRFPGTRATVLDSYAATFIPSGTAIDEAHAAALAEASTRWDPTRAIQTDAVLDAIAARGEQRAAEDDLPTVCPGDQCSAYLVGMGHDHRPDGTIVAGPTRVATTEATQDEFDRLEADADERDAEPFWNGTEWLLYADAARARAEQQAQLDAEDDAAVEQVRAELVDSLAIMTRNGLNRTVAVVALGRLLGACTAADDRAQGIVSNAAVLAYGDPTAPGYIPGQYADFSAARNAARAARAALTGN